MFKVHTLNTNYVPWRYGQVLHIERLGREWKGTYPFDIYDSKITVQSKDLYCDESNGHWKIGGIIDLNSDRLMGREPYPLLIETNVLECRLVKNTPTQNVNSIKAPVLHRPSSVVRYLIERAKAGDKRIDVKFCNEWLKLYYQAKKHGTSVLQQRKAKEQSAEKEKEKDKNKEKEKEKEKDKDQEKEKEKDKNKEKDKDTGKKNQEEETGAKKNDKNEIE